MVSPPDIEDFGRVEVTEKCCGAMTCRVLASEIFKEAKRDGNSKVRCFHKIHHYASVQISMNMPMHIAH